MAGSFRTNTVRSPHYGALQSVVDSSFADRDVQFARRLDGVVAAASADPPADLAESLARLHHGT